MDLTSRVELKKWYNIANEDAIRSTLEVDSGMKIFQVVKNIIFWLS